MNVSRLLCFLWAFFALVMPAISRPDCQAITSPTDPEVIFIPLVIHLVHNPQHSELSKSELEALVLPQIKRLNADFSMQNANFFDVRYLPYPLREKMGAAHIQFYLAPLQPDGTSSSLPNTGSILPGVTYTRTKRKSFVAEDGPGFFRALKQNPHGQAAWNPEQYVNVWVGEIETYSGVAQYPWQYHLGAEWQQADGVVIDLDVFGIRQETEGPRIGGRTLTHEIGHWLGLLHPFHHSETGQDDLIADTPVPQQAENAQHFTWENAPPALQTRSATTDNKAYFMNFMDYAWDDCRNSFTKGQIHRMRSVFSFPNTPKNGFSPEHLSGSRSYFQFPTISPTSGKPFLCLGESRLIQLKNVPPAYIRWEVSDHLRIEGPSEGVSSIYVIPKASRGTDLREIRAIITAPNGSGQRILRYQIEAFSPQINSPQDPASLGTYAIDIGSRIHISNYRWSSSPAVQIMGRSNHWAAQVLGLSSYWNPDPSRILSVNLQTDCAGTLTLIKSVPIPEVSLVAEGGR